MVEIIKTLFLSKPSTVTYCCHSLNCKIAWELQRK